MLPKLSHHKTKDGHLMYMIDKFVIAMVSPNNKQMKIFINKRHEMMCIERLQVLFRLHRHRGTIVRTSNNCGSEILVDNKPYYNGMIIPCGEDDYYDNKCS